MDLSFACEISCWLNCGSATAVANVGPGLGDVIGPAGNFIALPDAAKWVLCLIMILGRLEIITILLMITPRFWGR